MITNIKIKNYRNFKDIDLKLNPLSVLIGANGTGKTNLLLLFRLYMTAAHSQFKSTVVDIMGGISGISTDFNKQYEVMLEVDLILKEFVTRKIINEEKESIRRVLENTDYKYILKLGSNRFNRFIEEEILYSNKEEILSSSKNKLVIGKRNYTIVRESQNNPNKQIESKDNVMYLKDSDEILLPYVPHFSTLRILDYFKEIKFYKNFNFGTSSNIRNVQLVKDSNVLLYDGSNLVNVLHSIYSNNTESWYKIENVLKASFYDFERLIFSSTPGDGQIDLKWKFKNKKAPVSAYFLSDGQLKLLCILAILYSSERDELILIDEPEIYLHPRLQSLIGEVLKEVSEKKQIIVSTHSSELLNALEPEDVLTFNFNRKDGTSNIERLSSREDLKGWLENYKLGELWSMGEIGGRGEN